MPVARKNTRRSYRKRRPMLKNVLMHQRIAFAGGAGAVNPVAISGSNLGILNRACRIKWATLQYTSADPHTVQLTLFNTLGEEAVTSPTMLCHKDPRRMFVRMKPGADFGVIGPTSQVCSIFTDATSGSTIPYILRLCMEYSDVVGTND